MNRLRTSLKQEKGSALIAVLLLSLMMLVLLGGFLHVATSEYLRSDSSMVYSGLIHLGEAGADDALWALNENDWSEWKSINGGYYRELPTFDLDQNRKGIVRVFVDPHEPLPRIWVESQIHHPAKELGRKQILLELTATSGSAPGLIAVETIDFKGNRVEVDSYDSRVGPYNTLTNRSDQVIVGALSTQSDAVSIQNADIFGYLATNNVTPSFGPLARLYGKNTPLDVKVDPTRLTTDFSGEYLPVEMPVLANPLTSFSNGNGKGGNNIKIGYPSDTVITYYELDSLEIKSNQNVTVEGPVVIRVNGTIDIKGSLTIADLGSLKLYITSDMSVGGTGFVNSTLQPGRLQLFGIASPSATTTPLIKLHGNGAFHGVVYAPDFDLDFKGAGNSGIMSGSVVAKNIFFNGNANYHFDESLKTELKVNRLYKVTRWRESPSPGIRQDFNELAKY